MAFLSGYCKRKRFSYLLYVGCCWYPFVPSSPTGGAEVPQICHRCLSVADRAALCFLMLHLCPLCAKAFCCVIIWGSARLFGLSARTSPDDSNGVRAGGDARVCSPGSDHFVESSKYTQRCCLVSLYVGCSFVWRDLEGCKRQWGWKTFSTSEKQKYNTALGKWGSLELYARPDDVVSSKAWWQEKAWGKLMIHWKMYTRRTPDRYL